MHKLLYSTGWLAIYEGFQTIPYVLCPNGVNIVPVTPEGQVILIHEPTAYGNGERTLLLPGGVIDPGEDAVTAANRELQEEIGFSASRFDWLGEVRPWVKYLDATITIYLARDLTPSVLQGNENYVITQETVALDSFDGLIASGRLRDSAVMTALFLARQFLADS